MCLQQRDATPVSKRADIRAVRLSAVGARDKRVAVGAGLVKVAAEGADERRLRQVNVAVNLRWLDLGDDRRDVGGDLTNDAKPQEAFFFGGQTTRLSRPEKGQGQVIAALLALLPKKRGSGHLS
jgi:hypothetical protein